MSREPRLLSLGSIIVDEIFQVPNFPPPNGDVIATKNYRLVGGGLNILVAARRLGLVSAYAGSHGRGPNSEAIRSALDAERIEVLNTAQTDRDSGICVTFLEPNGARTFVTSPGIESEPRYSDLVALKMHKDDFIYISGYDLIYPIAGPVIGKFLNDCVRDQRIIFDPGPLIAQIPDSLLRTLLQCSAITSCNEDEYQFLLDTNLLSEIGHDLVIRRGATGASAVTKLESVHLSAPKVDVVDTTGAGDTHVGAMIAELARGKPLAEAVSFANVCAAISVTRYGPATGPTLDEITRSGLNHSA